MENIKLTREQTEHLVTKMQQYLQDELECDAGNFEVEFLLDIVLKQCGKHIYNQALYDAINCVTNRMPLLVESLEELEK